VGCDACGTVGWGGRLELTVTSGSLVDVGVGVCVVVLVVGTTGWWYPVVVGAACIDVGVDSLE
jgi:hypothetical protein